MGKMIEDELVSCKTAKLARKKGFNIKQEFFYDKSQLRLCIKNCVVDDLTENQYEAPTQSLLQKWLREKFSIYVRVDSVHKEHHYPWVKVYECDGHKKDYLKSYRKRNGTNFKTYEEALEYGLQEALKLIK